MAQAQCTPGLDRTARAAGIISRHEGIPVDTMDGFYQVRDTTTGSGRVYLTSSDRCTCPDHLFRGNVCKHIRAAQAEHEALATYADDWDRAVALQEPRCPQCGAPLAVTQYYTGGRGWAFYEVCSGDSSHVTRRG